MSAANEMENKRTSASEYKIVSKWTSQLDPDEISGILDCFESAFGEDTLRRKFKWKYIDNPFGDSLHLITWYRGVIVAARSFWKLDPFEGVLQCVDTTVKKNHQGKGIFKFNVDYLQQTHPDIKFYNYPNPCSIKQYLKYGWRITHDYRVKFNLAYILQRHAIKIAWSHAELEWRFASPEVAGNYFLSVGSGGNIFLWGLRRGVYPVLLGAIEHMLNLPIKQPLFGFTYDNLPGVPLSIDVRYIATKSADEYSNFFRFDMS